jgi:acetyl esterase/lipase
MSKAAIDVARGSGLCAHSRKRSACAALRLAGMLAVLSLFPTVLRAEAPAGITIEKGVVYSKLGSDKDLQLDIARPDGQGPFPAVVCIHGGAWRAGLGKRQDLSDWIKRLAEENYVAASVSYRLLPDAKFPEPIEDCKTAVRFLRANAQKYRIDPTKIGAMGFSAGGHLACLLGVTGKDAGFEGSQYADQSSRVQAVISYFGPTDLSAYANDDSAQNSTFVPLLGGRFKDKPEAYRNASPITYVGKDAPPFLFLHGTKDGLVSIDQSRSMCKKLKEAGAPAEIVELEGAGHGFGGGDARTTTKATLKFLTEKLKK